MEKMYSFVPNFLNIGEFNGSCTIEEIADEPSFFSSSLEFVTKHAGPLTKRILSAMESSVNKFWEYRGENEHLVIDTRVQRLMPGMYPSIPGWHCDNVKRESYYSQPDLSKMTEELSHVLGVISTHEEGVSSPEFIVSSHTIPVNYDSDDAVWKQVHNYIERSKHCVQKALDGGLYAFSQSTIHRAMPARYRGWRLFFRMSVLCTPPIGNKLTNSHQVYILSESCGW